MGYDERKFAELLLGAARGLADDPDGGAGDTPFAATAPGWPEHRRA